MLDPSSTSGLGMFEPLVSINQIQVYFGMHGEDLTQKCKILTVDNSKRTLEYIGNT